MYNISLMEVFMNIEIIDVNLDENTYAYMHRASEKEIFSAKKV